MDYITLQQLKDFLGITDTSSDTELEALITAICDMIDGFIGRYNDRLFEHSVTEYFDGDTHSVFPDNTPIRSLTSVEISEDYGDTWSVYEKANYSRIVYENFVRFVGLLPDGRRNVKLTFLTGFFDADQNAVPEDLKLLCLKLCQREWKMQSGEINANVKSKKVGDFSITYTDSDEFYNPEKGIDKIFPVLQKYARPFMIRAV